MEEHIDIIFILDESGSMFSMKNEPIEAVNDFIEEQQKLNDNTKFTLYTFNNKVKLVIDDKPLKNLDPFTSEDYHPSNMTALYDAIGTAVINKKNKNNNKNVIVVILTDGCENCSKEYKRIQIKNMIKEMEDDYKWNFIYLGATQDIFKINKDIGIKNVGSFDCVNPDGLKNACKTMSQSIVKYKKNKNNSDLTPPMTF